MTPPIIERIAAMRPVVRYAVSIGVALAAMLVRYALDPVLKTQSPYMVSLLGVFAAAWCCGLGPGLVAAAGGAVGATLFFLEPVFRLTVQPDEVLPLVLFCATAIGVAWITSELAALLRDLQNLQRVSDSALSSP